MLKITLVAVILGFSIGDTLGSYQRGYSVLDDDLGALEYTNTTSDPIEEFERDMCTTNGGENAYDDVMRGWNDTVNCIDRVQAEVSKEILHVSHRHFRQKNNAEYSEKTCQKESKLENCIRNGANSIKPCLNPEKHEKIDVLKNGIISFLKFMCEDEGARLKNFSELVDHGNECSESINLAMHYCTDPIATYIRSIFPNVAMVGGLRIFRVIEPDVDKCKILKDVQRCFVGTLNKGCKLPSGAELIESMLNFGMKVMTCDRLLGSNASIATSKLNIMMFALSLDVNKA